MIKLYACIRNSIPAILIYALNITVFAAIAFILFYDIPEYYDHQTYYTYKFQDFRSSFLSMFALQTSINHPDIFLKIYPQHKIVSMFFVFYSFWTIFIVLNIVVSIVYISYKNNYADIIRELPDKDNYSRILGACYDEKKQIVVLSKVEKMVRKYIEMGPEHLSFIIARQFQEDHEKNALDPIPPESELRDTGYNLKHRGAFMAIFNSRFYQYFFCGISIYICAAPVLILEDPRDEWQMSHYNFVEILVYILSIDPLLVLIFIGSLE